MQSERTKMRKKKTERTNIQKKEKVAELYCSRERKQSEIPNAKERQGVRREKKHYEKTRTKRGGRRKDREESSEITNLKGREGAGRERKHLERTAANRGRRDIRRERKNEDERGRRCKERKEII